jgi:hypothetical protein
MTRFPAGVLLIASAAVLGAAAASIATDARADILQPWCLSGGGGLTDHCDFATYAQCQTTAAGYGVCSPNPAYTAASPARAEPVSGKRGKR